MKKLLRNNGLSIVFFILFLLTLVGQAITGLKEYNQEMMEEGGRQLGLAQYLASGHFLEATFENWESEFLQMALFVVLTIFLYQKGSSESKDPDKRSAEVDRKPDQRRKDVPWPVRRGAGCWLSTGTPFLLRWLSYLYFRLYCTGMGASRITITDKCSGGCPPKLPSITWKVHDYGLSRFKIGKAGCCLFLQS